MERAKAVELVENIQPGECFYHDQVGYLGKGTYKTHIIAITEHKEYGGYVFTLAWYGKHKQYWHYEVKKDWEMVEWFKNDLYRLTREKVNA